MKKHKLNIAKSLELLEKCKTVLRKRNCYQNIYLCVEQHFSLFLSGKWKVAYGYYTTSPNIPHLLARHCFIIDENNQVIDPTVMLTHNDPNELLNWEYFDMIIFENYKSYIEALIKDEHYDLPDSLRQYDQNATIWANQNGYWLLD